MVRKVFITILASAMLFVSCRKEESMTEILLNLTEVTLSEGESVILNAAVNPSSAQVEWKSLDPSVARVQDGTVTAVSSGETYVLAVLIATPSAANAPAGSSVMHMITHNSSDTTCFAFLI